MVRDFSSVTTIFAMAMMPLALIISTNAVDALDPLYNQHRSYVYWSQRLFLASYIIKVVSTYLTYHHIGLTQLSNFLAQELWIAPCK